MLKKDLRKIYHQKRLLLSEADARNMSNQIADHFFKTFDFSNFTSIHIFLPIRHKSEIDTWLIVKKLKESFPHIFIIVPKINVGNNELSSIVLKEDTVLTENSWGIPEPEGHVDQFNESLIDMVILPLLALDNRGNRVGYGKGFYDKFLERCRKNVIKTGLTFFDPVEQISDVGSHDIPLDFCITPTTVYDFSQDRLKL